MPVKGLDDFLQAAVTIRTALDGARFLVVGEGPLRPELERRARELGIEDATQFLGFRADAVNVINLLDVFVMPSLHEGLPMALLEAMVLGKPIVATSVGGIPEVLRDLHSWLVPPREPRALASACCQAFAAATSRTNAFTLQKRIEEIDHLASAMVEQTRRLYRDVAAAKASGR
jgi:glycosyltransferase involved in cell wall biosynthesis